MIFFLLSYAMTTCSDSELTISSRSSLLHWFSFISTPFMNLQPVYSRTSHNKLNHRVLHKHLPNCPGQVKVRLGASILKDQEITVQVAWIGQAKSVIEDKWLSLQKNNYFLLGASKNFGDSEKEASKNVFIKFVLYLPEWASSDKNECSTLQSLQINWQMISTIRAPVFGTLNCTISNFQIWFVRTVMEVLKYYWM